MAVSPSLLQQGFEPVEGLAPMLSHQSKGSKARLRLFEEAAQVLRILLRGWKASHVQCQQGHCLISSMVTIFETVCFRKLHMCKLYMCKLCMCKLGMCKLYMCKFHMCKLYICKLHIVTFANSTYANCPCWKRSEDGSTATAIAKH